MAKRGQPKRFESAEQMIALWSDFCNEIVQNDFNSVPTQSAFCRWLSQNYEDTDRKTIYNSLNKYFPSIKNEFEQLKTLPPRAEPNAVRREAALRTRRRVSRPPARAVDTRLYYAVARQ